jgi:DNA repair photolyase
MARKTKTGGIQEYEVDDSINIQIGCENDCRYCYAKYDAVHRFRFCTAQGWAEPRINNKKVDSTYSNHGFVAFPSTHDITDRNISQYLCVLRKLLDAGNRVLIITKPRWQQIALICESFKEHRKKILWRFTIGSANDEVLQFWEPGASNFGERLNCLRYAFLSGYQTSVSCEPMLDAFVDHVYSATAEYITESFWIGLLRNFISRVDQSGISDEQQDKFIVPLLKASSPTVVKAMYDLMKDKPFIKWKESVRNMMEKYREPHKYVKRK